MKKRSSTYAETSGCLAPKDSAEFASWLQALPEYLREIMLAELRERQSVDPQMKGQSFNEWQK